jgi:hypothetical protein
MRDVLPILRRFLQLFYAGRKGFDDGFFRHFFLCYFSFLGQKQLPKAVCFVDDSLWQVEV